MLTLHVGLAQILNAVHRPSTMANKVKKKTTTKKKDGKQGAKGKGKNSGGKGAGKKRKVKGGKGKGGKGGGKAGGGNVDLNTPSDYECEEKIVLFLLH